MHRNNETEHLQVGAGELLAATRQGECRRVLGSWRCAAQCGCLLKVVRGDAKGVHGGRAAVDKARHSIRASVTVQPLPDLQSLLAVGLTRMPSRCIFSGRSAASLNDLIIEARGGDTTRWKRSRSRSVPTASTARKSSSSDEIRIGEDANTAVLKREEWNVLVELIQSGQLV